MRKLMLAGSAILVSLSLAACDRTNEHSDATVEDDTRVVERDSVPTEYEVTETVVEYDTTRRTKTVDANADHDNDDD